MKTGIFAFLLACVFNCSAQSWPEWVIQQQQSNTHITAVGIGENHLAAKQAAVADIVTQLSVDVSTQQQHTLSKRNGRASENFDQTTTANGLALTLTGLEVNDSVERNGLFALKVSVEKLQLINTLSAELSALSSITPPQNSPEQRFIWALQNSNTFSLASKKLAVLEYLTGTEHSYRATLKQLLAEQTHALNNITCRVVGAQNMGGIKSALNDALPQAGNTLLWMRPQLRWQYARSGNDLSARAVLTLALTRSESPFTVLLQRDLFAQESAATQENAKQKVINNLVQQLKAPVSQWLFDI